MSKFVPTPGMLTYVAVRPWTKSEFTGSGELVKTVVQDRSYGGQVFVCIARDLDHILLRRVYGGWSREESPQLFRLDQYDFSPVGPDIANHLGLNPEQPHTGEMK
jgi:hypothetical protein